MLYLKDAVINCDDFRPVEEVRRLFGQLYYGNDAVRTDPTLHLRVFKNNPAYSGVDANYKPLYVLIPSGVVGAVWPDEVIDCVRARFGRGGQNSDIPLMSVQLKDGTGLLFCLISDGGLLREEDSFGV